MLPQNAVLGHESSEEGVAVAGKMLTDRATWSYYSANSLKKVENVAFHEFQNKSTNIVKKLSI